MTRILEGVKVGDAVIVKCKTFGPDRVVRDIRCVDYATKVFRHVLQTRDGLTGVDIRTGRAVNAYGSAYVTPATDADVAEVLREIEERKRADAEQKAKQEAEWAAARRRDKLTGDIRDHLYRHVPEDVLIRALRVLRGEGLS